METSPSPAGPDFRPDLALAWLLLGAFRVPTACCARVPCRCMGAVEPDAV